MKHAVTLIELLVVIAIIATLVGILIPALARAKRSHDSNQGQKNAPSTKATFTYDDLPRSHEPMSLNTILLTDEDTDQEYIVVYSGSGVAITPRLPKVQK